MAQQIDRFPEDVIAVCDECLADRAPPWKDLEQDATGCTCPMCSKRWLWREPVAA